MEKRANILGGSFILESVLNLVKENYSNYCDENENWKTFLII